VSRKCRWAVGVVGVALAVHIWLVLPGLRRCYSYHRLISNRDILEILSVPATDIELPANEQQASFTLGYSTFALESEQVDSIKCYGVGVTIESEGLWFGFLRPVSHGYDELRVDVDYQAVEFDVWSKDLNISVRKPYPWEWSQVHPVARKVARQMMQDRFDWSVRVARTMPMRYSEVFGAEPDEFKEYLILSMAKAVGFIRARRVGIFEGEHIGGLVRFGVGGRDGEINAEIYSKNSSVWQNIRVRSDSAKKSKEALMSLLSSYRFVVAEVPEEEDLEELVLSAIGGHPKFEWAGQKKPKGIGTGS
jgi:hypothetical protein